MKKWPLLVLLFIAPFFAEGQVSSLDTLVRRFKQHREAALQEKIFAHLDRTLYLTGETLWFKIFAVDGSFHKPIDVSKVAYAEILDKGNFPVLQAKIELKNGLGSGSFFLPASLSSGNYRLRIYTNWMKNYDPEFYFDEVFSVINPFVVPTEVHTKPATKLTVQFFPEGGNLVSGIKSKIAFKISDGNGGVEARGFLMNNEGDTLSSFSPTKFGMGHFTFTPAGGERYIVTLLDRSGRTSSHAFPTVFPAGYVMHVADSADRLRVTVQSKGVRATQVFLFVHARQQMISATRQPLQNDQAVFHLKKRDMREGIAHLTVFDENFQPVCERLYFTYPEKNLDITANSNAKVYDTRSKVSLAFLTETSSGAPVPANLSLSVHKVDSLDSREAIAISPYLWLTSDLQGEIESPEYYFGEKGDDVNIAMDHLMLTHGWRRFLWENILDKTQAFSFLPEVNGHIVRGVVTQSGKKQRGIFTYLGSPGKIIRAYGSWSNAEGEIKFEIKDFYGPRRIIIQTKTDSSQMVNLQIDNPFSTRHHNDLLPSFDLQPERKQELLSRSIAMQVQDIFYKESGDRFEIPVVDSSAFYGKADNTYYLDDYTRFPVMEEVMREYVPGVFVRKRKDGFHFLLIDEVNGGVLPGDPMVLIDGVPVFDVDDIMNIDPLRVEKLEVVKRQYYLGQAAFSGIVSYSTYQGDLGGLKLDPGSISLDYDGLQLRREFYSPQYNTNATSERMPDRRYLLHWAPDIITGNDGKQTAHFYTSDVPGLYRVVVHGLNEEGFSGSKSFIFTVRASENQ